jgi:menaquinone-specific isochorismate synthase
MTTIPSFRVSSRRLDSLPGALVDLLPADDAPLSWVRRGQGLVGWGQAWRWTASGLGRFADAEQAWRRLVAQATVVDDVMLPGSGLVCFGSFSFDGASSEASVLVVPSVIVGLYDGVAWLTTVTAQAAVTTQAAEVPSELSAAVPTAQPSDTGLPSVRELAGSVPADRWPGIVSRALEHIAAGEVEKVVLARDVTLEADSPVNVHALLSRLSTRYADAWTFSVDGLVGATPELLLRSRGGLVTSRVLAGTIRRESHTSDDDALLRAAHLAASPKDNVEHEHAVESVARALAPFCSSMNVPEQPFVLHLPNVLHLATDITGALDTAQPHIIDPAHDQVGQAGQEAPSRQADRLGLPVQHPSSLTLAAALHPSAAVCGTPTTAAAAIIRLLEGFDRGRYAGPVGWMGADGDGEWGIALRCARLNASRTAARLYAGCGIIDGSDPVSELAESEAKLEPMRWAFAAI